MHVLGSNLIVMAAGAGAEAGRRALAAPIHAVDAATGVAVCGERPLVVFEDQRWPPEPSHRCPRCVRELAGGLASYD